MPSNVFNRWTLIACTAASLALPPAMAAELGEVTVLSHVGQPLLAEIELTALAPGEVNGVAVRLASPDVYRGGGISMDTALQALTVTPVERDGRRYVRVSTQQAIRAGHVHMYLLLGNGGSAIVRLATLWLTPAPAAAIAPLKPAPAPILPVSPIVPESPAAPDAAALAARARAAGLLRPASVFVAPPAMPRSAVQAVRPPMAVRAPALRRPAAPVAACAPQANAAQGLGQGQGQAVACLVLDQKNAALNDKLGELEGKIGVLQQALALPATAVARAAVPGDAAPAHAKPRPLPPPVAEQKAGGNGLLWLGGGTVAFLLLTAFIVYVLRKRKEAGEPAAPSKYWVLLRKPFRRKKQVPVLTEAVAMEVNEAEAAGGESVAAPFSR
ncbi:type IV pilus assembly protein FimV [Janthinobacterium sp. HLX7-2]|uniref:type IV pilus assembly protein FimV n=1 Tax=Janthinobacterium sp. HLX7-2 TaxID=1259331 RepID=UPI003F23B9F1